MDEGLVGGEGFAVDASLIKADANRQRGVPGTDGHASLSSARAVQDYIAVLDDAAFGRCEQGDTQVHLSGRSCRPLDRGARRPSIFSYSTNYLIDLDHAVIIDVEASTAIRQAEVAATKTMIERTSEQLRTGTRTAGCRYRLRCREDAVLVGARSGNRAGHPGL
jgi:hypothetical protein